MSALYILIICIFALQIFVPDGFNKFSDYFSVVYGVSILLLLRYYGMQPTPKAKSREYSLAKKDIPWQQKFVGTWDKIERPGFKEFAMLMGQSAFIAGMAEKQPHGNVIQYKDDSMKVMKIDMTGIPAQPGVWLELGGAAVPTKDPKGNAITDKVWFNEEEKKLYRQLEGPTSCVVQIREVTTDDKLVVNSTCTRKSDGQSVKFRAVLVRV